MSTHTWSFGRSIFFTGMALAAAVLVDQVVGCMSAPAQQVNRTVTSAFGIPATADDLIRQMSQSAGIIFVGEVVAVRRPAGFAGSAQDAAEGVIEVDFLVGQAIRGASPHSIYTLREWSGLWTGDADRYRAGRRLLMMLRPPDAAGLTSPVHGFEGAIPLRGTGAAPGPYEVSSTAAQWMVDVRWLQAQTQSQQFRTAGRPVPVGGGGHLHSELTVESLEQQAPELMRAFPGPWIEQNPPMQSVESLSHVLEICATSAESHDASR